MANSCTLLDKQPAIIGGNHGPIYVYKAILTSTSTDLIIRTPAAGKRCYLVGLFGCETSASNFTWKSVSGNLLGTLTTANGSAVITGSGTTFVNDFTGDGKIATPSGPPYTIVCSAGDSLVVSTVDSDTQITATTNSGHSNASQTYYRSMSIITPELGANQAIYDKVSGGYILAARPGDSLVANVSVAVSEVLLHVVEADCWQFPR